MVQLQLYQIGNMWKQRRVSGSKKQNKYCVSQPLSPMQNVCNVGVCNPVQQGNS